MRPSYITNYVSLLWQRLTNPNTFSTVLLFHKGIVRYSLWSIFQSISLILFVNAPKSEEHNIMEYWYHRTDLIDIWGTSRYVTVLYRTVLISAMLTICSRHISKPSPSTILQKINNTLTALTCTDYLVMLQVR